jgi:hypothetical protein
MLWILPGCADSPVNLIKTRLTIAMRVKTDATSAIGQHKHFGDKTRTVEVINPGLGQSNIANAFRVILASPDKVIRKCDRVGPHTADIVKSRVV